MDMHFDTQRRRPVKTNNSFAAMASDFESEVDLDEYRLDSDEP